MLKKLLNDIVVRGIKLEHKIVAKFYCHKGKLIISKICYLHRSIGILIIDNKSFID